MMAVIWYMVLMFVLGILTGFFWSRAVQYGKITDQWIKIREGYNSLQDEYKQLAKRKQESEDQ